jgi:peroxiredoxin
VELYRDYKPRGLEIIGVAMAYDPPEQVRALVNQRQLPYPIVLDSQGQIAREFDNVRLTPTSVLVSPDGRITQYRLGLLDMPQLRAAVEAML